MKLFNQNMPIDLPFCSSANWWTIYLYYSISFVDFFSETVISQAASFHSL